ncbi:DEAD/DEAH box helicase [Psychromonas algicola]|uniref:DEAD/DEAH box helicase n=1 Tax=Psychromonas algicola TaxID=2555642 RepID=UPI0010685CB9|nr:DEAD/DEAH box helicase [Psychromonas sp. RZ5]TEW49571.1 hypothetical protein E2R67_10650 [Psychromonas sp. RZ5]
MDFNRDHALKVLSFWQQAEFFNTLDLKNLLPGADDGVLQFTTEELKDKPTCLPWFDRQRIRAAGKDYYPNQQFAYTLYLGIFNRSEFAEQTKTFFTEEGHDEDWLQRRQDEGITCCAKIKLNAQAELQPESLEMSTAPWALGKLLQGQVDKLNKDDFDADVDKFRDRLHQINVAASNIKTEKQISSAFTCFELFEILKLLSSWAYFKPNEIRFGVIVQLNRQYKEQSPATELMLPEHAIESFKRLPLLIKNAQLIERDTPEKLDVVETTDKVNEDPQNLDESSDVPILNSFYIDDIAMAFNAIKKNKLLTASPLTQFLATKVTHATDLFTKDGEQIIANKLRVKNTPLGRWPDDKSHTMSLMQQFSINTLEEHVAAGGLYSVNGPPGTGKTTMLRDIIAANVVKRASVLSKLKNIEASFLLDTGIKVGDEMVIIKPLIPELCGYEMVVVSSNNTAVENITKELPQNKALGEDFSELNYLKTVAQKVAANVIEKKKQKYMSALPEQDDCWGFIAAALGNSGNRRRFNSKVFFDKAINMTCDDVSKNYQTLVEAIKFCANGCDVVLEFKKAQEKFKQAEKDVNQALNDIARLERLSELKRKLTKLHIEMLTRESIYQRTLKYLLVLEHKYLPWWHYRIFKRCKQKTVIKEYRKLVARKHSDFSLSQSEYNLFLVEVTQEVEACAVINETHHDVTFYDENAEIDSAVVQRKAFGHSQHLNLVRSTLTASAFELHQAWLVASYNSGFDKNINKFSELLKANIASPEDAKIMWQSFFMICPVVSSAFASVANQFSKLGQGDIGWLFIDESGQATPQQAVGALFRAKRAIVVGDPLQIEPVLTTPPEIIENLGRRLLQDDWLTWSPTITSVQELADRVNPFGTNKIALDKWLGSPLRVHRRCSDPMFSIANKIAYNSKMLHGSNDIREEDDFVWGASTWLNIQGSEENKHYVPEQAEHVLGMLYQYVNRHGELPECYIISPFTKVKLGLIKHLKNNFSHSEISNNYFEDWLSERVGTVHTFQGKEEKLVIFVLGASDSAGAASWAASKPNLLNVALTRAKKRVYLIGCYEMWSSLPYFSDAFSHLHVK